MARSGVASTHSNSVFVFFTGTSMPISTVVAIIYIPAVSIEEFFPTSLFASVCFYDDSHPCEGEVVRGNLSMVSFALC